MKKIMTVLFLGALVLSLFLSGCAQEKEKVISKPADQPAASSPTPALPEEGTEPAPETEVQETEVEEDEVETEVPVEESTSAADSSAKEFNVVARNWEFVPGTIVVNQGDTVTLHIKSEDVTHGFLLSAFKVNENLPPGEQVDVTFVADKKGTFSFICSVFCGNGHGQMTGKLVVQ